MTHADAFLQDILAHPDDDAPRLIFADWLEEQGDAASVARAEFIRGQCALAVGNLPEQHRAKLEKQQKQLIKQYGRGWAHPINQWAAGWYFQRGFIHEVVMRVDRFFAHVDQLFRLYPVQILSLGPDSYTFGDLPLNIAEFADIKHLRRLRGLGLSQNGLVSRDVRALVVSEHLTCLTDLHLSYNRIGDSGIRALAAWPLLGQLEHLNLCGNDIGATGVRALTHALEELACSPDGLRLRLLALSYHNLSAAGQRVIADSPVLRRLVRS